MTNNKATTFVVAFLYVYLPSEMDKLHDLSARLPSESRLGGLRGNRDPPGVFVLLPPQKNTSFASFAKKYFDSFQRYYSISGSSSSGSSSVGSVSSGLTAASSSSFSRSVRAMPTTLTPSSSRMSRDALRNAGNDRYIACMHPDDDAF